MLKTSLAKISILANREVMEASQQKKQKPEMLRDARCMTSAETTIGLQRMGKQNALILTVVNLVVMEIKQQTLVDSLALNQHLLFQIQLLPLTRLQIQWFPQIQPLL